MKFTISFLDFGRTFPGETICPGLRLLDLARVQLGPKVRADDLPESQYIPAETIEMAVDEATARASGHFNDGNEIRVQTDQEIIDSFKRLVPYWGLGGKVCFRRTLDQAIIQAWAEAGYPLRWRAQVEEEASEEEAEEAEEQAAEEEYEDE